MLVKAVSALTSLVVLMLALSAAVSTLNILVSTALVSALLVAAASSALAASFAAGAFSLAPATLASLVTTAACAFWPALLSAAWTLLPVAETSQKLLRATPAKPAESLRKLNR